MRKTLLGVAVVVLVACVGSPAKAQVEFRGVGPRVGLSQGPDQVLVGAQFDLGEFAKNVRWQPSVELGFGDDATALLGNFMVSYYFPVKAAVTPYAGGEVTIGYYRYDNDPKYGDDSKTRIGPAAVGGIEMKLKGGSRFLAELQVGFNDIHEVRAIAGWTF